MHIRLSSAEPTPWDITPSPDKRDFRKVGIEPMASFRKADLSGLGRDAELRAV